MCILTTNVIQVHGGQVVYVRKPRLRYDRALSCLHDCGSERLLDPGLQQNCYNLESAGSQAPRPDVCTRRRRSDIPCQGGQYVLTVVSRHYVACELLTVRKSSYTQASMSHICAGLVPSTQGITSASQSSETHLKRIKPHVMHCHT